MKNFKKFGKNLKNLRIQKELSLREVCKLLNYDPSNWSKIERGVISPPSDERVLKKWAKALGLSRDAKELQEFVDMAQVAQGVIPEDILSSKNAAACLPAFFRTLRNKKPSKNEVDKLIQLIKNA